MPPLFRTIVVIGLPDLTAVSISNPDIPKAPSPIKFKQNLSGIAIFAPIIKGIPYPR